MRKLVFLFVAIIFVVSMAQAQTVPPLINYQGTLTDSDGKPLTGTKKITFNLYDSAVAVACVWGPQLFENVPLINGKFNVILGTTDTSGRSLADAFGAKDRYLGITVDGKEILPRQQILSTPFALKAEQAAKADSAANADKIGNNSIQDLIAQCTDSKGVLTISGVSTSTTQSAFTVSKVISNTLLTVTPQDSNITIPVSGNYIATTTIVTCISGSRGYINSSVRLNGNDIAGAVNEANECGSAVATASIYANKGDIISGMCKTNQGVSSSCSFSLVLIGSGSNGK